MGYTITVRVFQTNTNALFHIVEKTILNDGNGGNGTWVVVDGAQVLNLTSSGTSGVLRFLVDADERFVIALGIDSGLRWGDIVARVQFESHWRHHQLSILRREI